jgi:phosphatidylglycerol:prolipoprotein diacylglycerol transferase
MLTYPEIDPIAIAFGTWDLPVLGITEPKIHWYGLMYLGGFVIGWWLARQRTKRPNSPIKAADVDDLIFYGALGVVIGGRLGYSLFYHFDKVIERAGIDIGKRNIVPYSTRHYFTDL